MREASASYYLADTRLAACAVSQEPVWLWRVDGTRALWANAAGAAIFGAATVAALQARRFDDASPSAREVLRLAGSLPDDGHPRLERLSGFGAGFMLRPLICACSRIKLSDNSEALLLSGAEPSQPPLPLADRAQRLFGSSAELFAAFTLAGDLVAATPAARTRLKSAANLAAIGATELAADAMTDGTSAGAISLGPVNFWRVGRDAETLLVARIDAAPEIEQVPEIGVASDIEVTATESAPALSPAAIESENLAVEIPPENPVQWHSTAEAWKAYAAEPVRRHPLRFVWHLDADQNFTITSEEFLEIVGPDTVQKNGTPWSVMSAALDLDPGAEIARAVATHDTFSGITVSWPTSSGDHVKVELSGLPIFDRQRQFTGYRGFGVCRDLAQIDELRRRDSKRQTATAAADSPLVALTEVPRPLLNAVPSGGENVVPFPAALAPPEPRTPVLNAGERKAFSDIAQQLAARLRNTPRSEHLRENETPPIATTRTPQLQGIDGRAPAPPDTEAEWLAEGADVRLLLDRLPLGVLIYRAHEMLYANREFLDRVGYPTLADFAQGGGLDNLLLGSAAERLKDSGPQTLSIATGDHRQVQTEARLVSMPFGNDTAFALVLTPPAPETGPPARTSIRENGEDRAIEKLLEKQIGDLRRHADQIESSHAEFLTRVSHDMRTPLTAIVGFAEAILGERFGPVGNERYRDYLSGINNAAGRILALIDDFDRAPKTEESAPSEPDAAKETIVDLNLIVQSCVAELQPQASRERVLIRTSLVRPLPSVAADVNAVRQIVLNLLTNSIRLAGAGGQVIISTGVSGAGSVSLRLRDTGIGVNESDVTAAMRPMPATGEKSDAPEGRLKLAVAKALVEANRASLKISSKPNDGTLVEVSFREQATPAA